MQIILRIPIRIDQQDSFPILSFTAIREGKYDLIITYAGNSLPNMPIRNHRNVRRFYMQVNL